jgi:CheY-like chemotaxis protein
VTEFEDSVERAWYDDYELMRLKHETVLLAQEYLMTHQHEAEKYNKVKLDPVTGTYRKRALFSLPVLASTLDEGRILNPSCGEYSEIVQEQVKNILVVDPNPAIQQLLLRSMKSMFPGAEIHASQSGEEALKLSSAQLHREYGSTAFQHRNFDVIIVEQCLCQSLHDPKSKEQEREKLTGNHACVAMASMANTDTTYRPRRLQKPSSFAGSGSDHNHGSINMRGSDLITAIQELEADVFASSKTQQQDAKDPQQNAASSSNETTMSMPTKLFQWRSLLIGVSMQPDRDAGILTEAGADVIWGKPIPHIGDALRNQLVQSLVNKRRTRW